MPLPNVRSGPPGGRTASSDLNLTGSVIDLQVTAPPHVLQARRIARRFSMSWPVALVVADHAFHVEAMR